ncbi:BnaCnng19110D [Brassica napus]|uniref:BnaCnng19110D protein n=1 Tax=Brassica napus TaxID=3708 RepID=A0A078ILW8_BRANA|nr:BnaCnng19110D [Brassica napus]
MGDVASRLTSSSHLDDCESLQHEINRKQIGFQVWEGEEIDQKRRISVTLRKLCPS